VSTAPQHEVAWHLHLAENGVARLAFDVPGRSVNTFGGATLAELGAKLDQLATWRASATLRALLITSAKPGTFIAGAELSEFATITDVESARRAIVTGQELFGRIAELGVPTAAAIEGVCVGGGLELALACELRVGSRQSGKLGLPEVKLGIVPAWGGTQRLPRVIGLPRAIELITSGKLIDPERAWRLGLLDELVPAGRAVVHAEHMLLERLAGKRPPLRRRSWREWLLTSLPGRPILFALARRAIERAAGRHYPAPLAALHCIAVGAQAGLAEGLNAELESGAELIVSQTSRNLVSLFFLSEAARKDETARKDQGNLLDIVPQPAISRIAVLGAGVMGAGIAQLAARHGVAVRLRDPAQAALDRAQADIARRFASDVARRTATTVERAAGLARVTTTRTLQGLGDCEIAIEAVVERLDLKQRVLVELENLLPAQAILATNTSSLAIDRLASALQRPERLVGLHFFNPVHRMPLVEVVQGPRTAAESVRVAVAFARQLNKTPVVVGDGPGFLVNRVLLPMLDEPARLLQDGATASAIDQALCDFGLPLGPFALLDTVGADVALEVARIFRAAFPQRVAEPAMLERLVAAGRLGRKNAQGIYRGGEPPRGLDPRAVVLLGGRPAGTRAVPHSEIVDRIVLRMVSEAEHALAEGVARSPEDVDLALIFGAGFPPFHGGLLAYADQRGLAAIVSELDRLAERYGERFAAPAGLRERAVQQRCYRQSARAAGDLHD
jgi:3-hydroxyacyl-CoA dehydrogenase/enoyl-CoA hydratase/carnithine racemase